MKQVYPLYFDLLYKINLTKFQKLHPYFVKKVESLYKKNSKNNIGWNCNTFSTIGIYELDFDENYLLLRSDIEKNVCEFADQFGVKHSTIECSGSWLNLSKPGAFQEYHKHPHSHFSIAYYVQVPLNSGSIVFQSHENISDMFPLPTNSILPPNYKTFRYTPNEGDLLIFRSNLLHMVEPNNSKKNRVSISSNFIFR